MKLTEFCQVDPSIKIVKNSEWPEEILAIRPLDATTANSCLFIKNTKYLHKFLPGIGNAQALKIGVVIDEKLFGTLDEASLKTLNTLAWVATSSNVALSLTLLSKSFYDKKMQSLNSQVDGRQMGTVELDPTARIAQNVFIGEHVKIGANVEIMPGCVILPHVEIGDNTTIYPNVTLYPFTKIGKGCRIHSGVVIGADGFGYTFHQGQHLKIWHMGGVEIHNDVEIGSNTSIDCGTFSPTIIGAGTKLDNLVQIAHNVKLGKGCVICGQSGIAGSAILHDYVVLGGSSKVGPDAVLGMGTQIAGGAMVNESAIWPAGSKLGGHPAKDLKEWMRGVAFVRNASLRKTKDS